MRGILCLHIFHADTVLISHSNPDTSLDLSSPVSSRVLGDHSERSRLRVCGRVTHEVVLPMHYSHFNVAPMGTRPGVSRPQITTLAAMLDTLTWESIPSHTERLTWE